MKLLLHTVLILFFAFSCVSCSDDEDPGLANDDIPGALVAIINGESFDFRYQPRAYTGNSEIGGVVYEAISIHGSTNNNLTRELDISITNPAVGTFEIEADFLNFILFQQYFEDGTGDVFSSTSGTIVVTEYGSRIKGSFNATLYNYDDDMEIPISGTFDLKITE